MPRNELVQQVKYLAAAALMAILLFRLSAPFQDKLHDHIQRIRVLRQNIDRSAALIAARDSLGRQAEQIRRQSAENRKLLWQRGETCENALAAMDKSLRALLAGAGMEVVSISWGEPVTVEGGGYTRLPISFTVEGPPDGLAGFAETVARHRPALRTERITIQRKRKHLRISGLIAGYTLLPMAQSP